MLAELRRIVRRTVADTRAVAFDSLNPWLDSVTVRTLQGRLTIDCADGTISRHLFAHRNYELSYISKVLALLRELGALPPAGRGTVVDVGANIGVTGIGMLWRGELGRAVAIEPDPRNFRLLTLNVRQNGLEDRMVCLEAGVSDAAGTSTLYLSPTNFGDHRLRPADRAEPLDDQAVPNFADRSTETMRTTTLDSLEELLPEGFLDDLALVWIDTQGHEGRVLAGGASLLSRRVPVVCEIWPHGLAQMGTSPDELYAMARSLWSSLWIVRRGRLVRYPISFLPTLFHELDDPWLYDNVLFW